MACVCERGHYLSNMNCVCVCVYLTGRGTSSVMLVPIPFFVQCGSVSVKLQALHTHAHHLWVSVH